MLSGDGSVAASANVSSNGDGDEVADIHDFDDPSATGEPGQTANLAMIKKLQDEMAEDKIAQDLLKEEMAGKDAESASKVARLLRQAAQNRTDAGVAGDTIAELRQSLLGEGVRHQNSMEAAQIMLAAAQMKNDGKDLNIEELKQELFEQQGQGDQDRLDVGYLRQQLFMATAAKRFAETRAEDYKDAMTAMKLKHGQVVSDLRQRIQTLKDNTGEVEEDVDGLGEEPGREGPMNEVAQLRNHVAELTEERNMFINTLEWNEVHWRSSIEDLEQQMASQSVELKTQHDAKVAEMRLRLEGEIAELKQRLAKQ